MDFFFLNVVNVPLPFFFSLSQGAFPLCPPCVGLTSGVAGVERVVGGHPLDAAEQDHVLTFVTDHGPFPADHHVAHGKCPVYVVDLGTSQAGVAWLLIARSVHHLHFLLSDWPSNIFQRCQSTGKQFRAAPPSNLVIRPSAPPCGEKTHCTAIIYGPDCRHSRSPPLEPVCCLRPPPGQILLSSHTARGYLCAALRSILIQGIRIFFEKRQTGSFLSLSNLFLKMKWPGLVVAYLF